MDAFINKTYKSKSVEKFDEFLKFLGVNMLVRKAILSVKPEVVLTKNADGSYTFTINSTLKTQKTTFCIGGETTDERIDGAKTKSTWELVDGNKLVETQIDDKGRKSVITQEYTANTLTVTFTVEGWDGTAIRIYELV